MYELMVETEFSAAHRIKEAGGGCERLHGHNWRVQVFLQGEKLNKNGMLMDFRKLKEIVKKRVDRLDHQYLNEVLGNKNPTTENLAKYLFQGLSSEMDSPEIRLSKVRVGEVRDTWVSYSQGGIE